MFNWTLGSRTKSDSPNIILLSKLTKEDILLLQYNENLDITFDFNNLGFFQIRRLIMDIYPLIKDSTNPKLELLARTIYSLSKKIKIKYIELYLNKKLVFCEDYEYVATIEAIKKSESDLTRIAINIYPFSIKCLPCYRIASLGWGIIPLRRMYIDEFHQLIKQCKSLQEFKQSFNFYITYPHKGNGLAFDNPYQLNIVDIILNGIQGITLEQARNYIEKFNMNFEAIKSKIENKLFERLKSNINQGRWGTLIDIKLLHNYTRYDEYHLIAYPDKIKETFKKICQKEGGIII